MTVLLVAAGGAAGAGARFVLDGHVCLRFGPAFPWATLLVNAVGSLLLGWLTGAALSGGSVSLLGTGFCGALTTYSTFSWDTVRLFSDGARWRAVSNLVGTVGAGLACGALGLLVGSGHVP